MGMFQGDKEEDTCSKSLILATLKNANVYNHDARMLVKNVATYSTQERENCEKPRLYLNQMSHRTDRQRISLQDEDHYENDPRLGTTQ